jgi:hypothetical protein
MADVHNTATPARILQSGGLSFNMSLIKGKNTKPEMKISGAKCCCGGFCLQMVTGIG